MREVFLCLVVLTVAGQCKEAQHQSVLSNVISSRTSAESFQNTPDERLDCLSSVRSLEEPLQSAF